MSTTTTALIQSALKIIGTALVAKGAITQEQSDSGGSLIVTIIGAGTALIGVFWHVRTAGGPAPKAAPLIMALICAGAVSCTSAGRESWRFGLVGGGIGAKEKTPTATNSWVFNPGVNLTNMVQLFMEGE